MSIFYVRDDGDGEEEYSIKINATVNLKQYQANIYK